MTDAELAAKLAELAARLDLVERELCQTADMAEAMGNDLTALLREVRATWGKP